MDDCFWEELIELDAEDVCRRSGAEWKGEAYLLRILGAEYLLTPSERRLCRADVDPDGEEASAASALCFVAVHYLLNAADLPLSGELVAARELKGGKLFFAAGAHSPDFTSLEEILAVSPEAIERGAARLGGRKVEHGDTAVEIPALQRLPITFVFWRGDEEFPPSTSMLFDRTAESQLPLDVILALGQETMRRLVAGAREEKAQLPNSEEDR